MGCSFCACRTGKGKKTMKKAILVVSFGTSYHDTLEKTILATEEAIAQANPGWEVRRAFTSAIIMRKLLARDNLQIDSVAQAMAKLEAEGFTHVAVVSELTRLYSRPWHSVTKLRATSYPV